MKYNKMQDINKNRNVMSVLMINNTKTKKTAD